MKPAREFYAVLLLRAADESANQQSMKDSLQRVLRQEPTTPLFDKEHVGINECWPLDRLLADPTVKSWNHRWFRFVKEQDQLWTWVLLTSLYGMRPRYYHNMEHIKSCLMVLDSMADLMDQHRKEAELAIWWHDAVYVPGSKDNEMLSASLLTSLARALTVDIHTLQGATVAIEFTRGHPRVAGATSRAVLDADLSVLGAPAATYDAYVAAIRSEYKALGSGAWRSGRSSFLRSILTRESIYQMPQMVERFEEQARANLTRELDALSAG